MVAGLHVPLMPLLEVAGSAVAVAPTQNEPTGANVGTTWSVIVMSIVTGVAQGSSGVKVYDVVPTADVLIVEGFHVPENPFSETVGSAVGVAFRQKGPIGAKV